jgi:hypothetical protein
MKDMNIALLVGGSLSLIAALAHVAIIIGGPDWYRFFGAGEKMARLAEQGALYPTLITLAIATVLGTWALYGFAGAGLLPALPLMRPALVAITAIYLLRGLVPVGILLFAPSQMSAFWLWSSAICFGFGLAHLIGVRAVWASLP